ncbi:uncharacterized protein FSUBG_6353 [Fusarium subglutinans]|uniref:Uncharacterized protein n=1 Tax=Gibberella subglutinans TaxID=42677 RepID=A0A8H5V1X0_GIBSU|nr:uncharacterized protein FSUBG_6353 [Fusarium subglutinans]KAF5605750.1 hypothetical protein FSUBG_6353 [Fusarium subglutinans]
MRSYSRLALQLITNLSNPEIINLLGTSPLSEMVTLEIIWGENRLRNFDLRDFDNAIIAEGQYIAKCISDTCFSVMDFLDILYEEEEEERVAEWNRLVRYVRQAKILAQELVSLPAANFPPAPRVLPVSRFPRLLTFIAKVPRCSPSNDALGLRCCRPRAYLPPDTER